jgi:ferredoxin--NADP+ reductase
VFRAIGYRGVALPGLPFDERSGVLPNEEGRLLANGAIVPRQYATGWCRRGPSGVVGTNKPDAQLVAEHMAADAATLEPRRAPGSIDALLAARGVRVTSFDDWRALDAVELERGRERGKLREKLTSIGEMLGVLDERQQLRGAGR